MSEVKEKPDMAKIKKANAGRLKRAVVNNSRQKSKTFTCINKHADADKKYVAVVIGTLDFKEYVMGYKSRETAIDAMNDLNKQFFS